MGNEKLHLDTHQFKVVGTRPVRPDGVDKVTGRAAFGADFTLPGMLCGQVVRSPHAHARIRGIDTSAALALPGVRAVVTAVEVAQAGLGPIMPLVVLKGSNGQEMHSAGMPILADGVVRHVGEPVALVVADTLE